ncbi:MAG: hypothetical protein A3B11_00415 [Candidatus Taylorbacteria bacterium RIFCSPLOWO2_01_FULL_44_26]|uniref:Plasmid stabilization protein n=2 Tax=Candidatus Tayloriibacteriota TaxID=1817919 RepID=A0A1G2MLB0_9BACT|nr:MAG: hypothetical protein A3D50_00325 [Candidatus Taylorbacteria bacterium RIFCSPHIGHO2_02_FULL_44_12]OHA31220.1 MAG: hypothetical protein A3B11_00415 [Candidatus Taylorbacteria bacterium RIFCSPLOWO2_01_FULL_44_26]
MKIAYKAIFIRQFDDLPIDLQSEVLEKIGLLKIAQNHQQLKVHKLHGSLQDRYSFSVNYKIRIVFRYLSKNEIVLLVIGDHDIYR